MADPPDPPRFRAIQINSTITPGTDSTQAFGINNKGEVTGVVYSSETTGLLWLPNAAYNLGHGSHSLIAANVNFYGSLGFSINDNGRVAGWRRAQYNTADRLNIWNLPAYSGAGDIIGEEIEEHSGTRVAINNDDVAVGIRWGFPGGFRVQWFANGSHIIDPLESFSEFGVTVGLSIGNSGLVGGGFSDPGCGGCGVCSVCGGYAGALWSDPTVPSPLEHHGAYVNCSVYDITSTWPHGFNDQDRIVGAGWDPTYEFEYPPCVHVATFWPTPTAQQPLRLPWPSGMADHATEAHSISNPLENDFVYVAGWNAQEDLALLWRVQSDQIGDGNQADWEAFDLNEPGIVDLRETQFEFLREATGVNNMGWISGWGQWFDGVMRTRAFILVPLDVCAGDITGPLGVPDGKVGVADLLQLLADWGDCPSDPSTPCWADLNGDGVVGVADLLILLANWGICPGNSTTQLAASLEQELAAAGISQQAWDDFMDVLSSPSFSLNEELRWICWFEQYMTGCTNCRPCRGTDPFLGP